jgi:hypothetical protein
MRGVAAEAATPSRGRGVLMRRPHRRPVTRARRLGALQFGTNLTSQPAQLGTMSRWQWGHTLAPRWGWPPMVRSKITIALRPRATTMEPR